MTNRCLTVLRMVFNYAIRRKRVSMNPAIGVEKHDEKQRDRLIAKAEYDKIYAQCGPRLQVIMDLLYLTGQRVRDVLTIKRADLTPEGINFKQQKTGKKLLVRWTPELQAVVDRAKTLRGNITALTLLHNRLGKSPDYTTVKLQWDVARTAAGIPDVQMRDLRAMSLTETDEQGKDAMALGGHASRSMTRRYLRRKKISKVDGPSF
jgi:integrase